MMGRRILALVAMATMMTALWAQDQVSLFKPLGLGFQVGVGGMMPTASLADDFKGCVLFTGGINCDYRRLRLTVDLSYGQPSFKNENPYAVSNQRNATANPTLLAGTAQLGYTVWRQGRVAVTPALGLTASRLSWDLNHIKYESDDDGNERPMIDDVTGTHENNLGWTASVNVDIRLHGKVVDHPVGDDGQAHYTSMLRVSPFITGVKFNHFNPVAKGCCLGVTVSYAGLLRAIVRQ